MTRASEARAGISHTRRHNRPGVCGQCHAEEPHPKAPCPVCEQEFMHIAGVYMHLPRVHGILTKTRAHAMAMDYARAVVRRWPTAAPLAWFRATIG